MKMINDFLKSMEKVAKTISLIEDPEIALNIFLSKYELLLSKSRKIDDDLNSLLKLSSAQRLKAKRESGLKIGRINDLFQTNRRKYETCGYYDSAMGLEFEKFSELFTDIQRFNQNLNSTFSKSYTIEELRLIYDKDYRYRQALGKEIKFMNIDIEELTLFLSPHFIDPTELKKVLYGNLPKDKLTFVGPAAKLFYVFNKLQIKNKIRSGKGKLIGWFVTCFEFKEENSNYVKNANPTTISSNQYRTDINDFPTREQIKEVEKFY